MANAIAREMKAILLLMLITIVFASGEGRAAERQKVPRIGILLPGHAPPLLAAFHRGLKKLGYIEGRNFFVEHPYWNYKETRARLPELAAELVNRKVALIVAHEPAAVVAAMKATKAIPIVTPDAGSDPVGSGFVTSLAYPAGNVTGLYTGSKGLAGKRLELLKEILPSVRRVAFLNPHLQSVDLNDYKHAAEMLDLDLDVVDLQTDGDIAPALAELMATPARLDALVIGHHFLTHRNAIQIGGFLRKNRIPAISSHKRYVRLGGLASYGVNLPANWRRAAVFVDKILKGANPATLPVEPPQLELVINLRTAEKIGVTIPPEILLEANKIIK
ncbi:MAG TPA: ABC transporter substrate-binding protein [Candidatus Binatia bacterium]|nr:ABC transporter substrate-binding protein [Candidatus Binatia bacterium]